MFSGSSVLFVGDHSARHDNSTRNYHYAHLVHRATAAQILQTSLAPLSFSPDPGVTRERRSEYSGCGARREGGKGCVVRGAAHWVRSAVSIFSCMIMQRTEHIVVDSSLLKE